MTRAEVEELLAAGHLTLREVADAWRVSLEDAYRLLYGAPMPAPAAPPPGRGTTRQPRRTR